MHGAGIKQHHTHNNNDDANAKPIEEGDARAFFIDALSARGEGLRQALTSDVLRFLQPTLEDDPSVADPTKATTGLVLATDELMGSCTFSLSSNERRNAVSSRLQEGANGAAFEVPTRDQPGSQLDIPFPFLGVAPLDEVTASPWRPEKCGSWEALRHFATLCVVPSLDGRAVKYASPLSQADVLFSALLRQEIVRGAESGEHQLIGSRFPTTAHVVHEYQGREEELLEELPPALVEATLSRYLGVAEALLPTRRSSSRHSGEVLVMKPPKSERNPSPTHDGLMVSDSSLDSEEFGRKMNEVLGGGVVGEAEEEQQPLSDLGADTLRGEEEGTQTVLQPGAGESAATEFPLEPAQSTAPPTPFTVPSMPDHNALSRSDLHLSGDSEKESAVAAMAPKVVVPAWRRKVNRSAIQDLVDAAVAEDVVKPSLPPVVNSKATSVETNEFVDSIEGAHPDGAALATPPGVAAALIPMRAKQRDDIRLEPMETLEVPRPPASPTYSQANDNPEHSPPLEPFRRVISESPALSRASPERAAAEPDSDVSESDGLPFGSLLKRRHDEAAAAATSTPTSETPRRRGSVTFVDDPQNAYLTSPFVNPPQAATSSPQPSTPTPRTGTSDLALRVKRLKAMQRLCFDAMNVGYVPLDEKTRRKVRVCQCKLAKDSSKVEVSVSIEWGEFLVIKKYKGGLAGKEVMLIHPLVSGLVVQKGGSGTKELVLVMEQMYSPEDVHVTTGVKGGPQLDPETAKRVISPRRHIPTPTTPTTKHGDSDDTHSSASQLHTGVSKRIINVTLILPNDRSCERTIIILQDAVKAAHQTFEHNIATVFSKRLVEAEKSATNSARKPAHHNHE